MATVYSQTWAAGNPANWTDGFYRRDVDGVDPTYPEIYMAEGVTVSGGKVVKHATYSADHGVSGIVFENFPAFNGAVGSISVKYTPNATVLSATTGLFYVPLIMVFGTGSTHKMIVFALNGARGAPFTWDIQARNRNTNVMNDAFFGTAAQTFVAGTEYEFKVCWKCGTFDGTTTASDGYAKFYVNDALVHEILNFPMTVHPGDNNFVNYVGLGADVIQGGGGLFGAMGNIAFSDSECGVVSVVDNAVLCCADGSPETVASGGGQGAGATPVMTPALGGAALGCVGGGTVPTQASLTHSETWWSS